MTTYQEDIQLSTDEMIITDITSLVQTIVSKSLIKTGIVNIFNVGSTAALSTIEYEQGLLTDFPSLMQKLVPKGEPYEHDMTWGDDNGHSHLRATLLKPSLTVPIQKGQMILGTWQQIIHIEFDHRPRKRRIVVTVTGD